MSVIWTQQQHLMQQLYRFAYALCGDSSLAVEILEKALDHLHCNPEATEHDRAVRKLVLLIRKYCFQKKPPVKRMPALLPLHDGWEARLGNVPLTTILNILKELPDPTFSAAALFYATTILPEEIARILGINLQELSEKIQLARCFLATRLSETPTIMTNAAVGL